MPTPICVKIVDRIYRVDDYVKQLNALCHQTGEEHLGEGDGTLNVYYTLDDSAEDTIEAIEGFEFVLDVTREANPANGEPCKSVSS